MSISVCQLLCNAGRFCFSVNLNLFQTESRVKHKIFMNVQPRTGTFTSCREEFLFFFIYPEVAATVVRRGRNRYDGCEYSGRVIVHFLWLPDGPSGELQGHITPSGTDLCRTLHNNTAVLLGTLKSSSWLGEDSDLAWLSIISFIRVGWKCSRQQVPRGNLAIGS